MSGDEEIELRFPTPDADAASQKIDQLLDGLHQIREASQQTLESSQNIFSVESIEMGVEALRGGIEVMRRLGEAIVDSAIEAERHARAMHTLGGTMEAVSRATNDAVSAEVAMAAQQRMLQAGLTLTDEQFAAVVARAREYALRTGTDVPAAIDQLAGALIGGRERALRPFGIELDAGIDRQHGYAQAMQQIQDHMASTTPEARTLGEEVARTNRNFHEFIGEIASGIADFLHLRDVISAIGDAFEGLSSHALSATEALARARHEAEENQEFLNRQTNSNTGGGLWVNGGSDRSAESIARDQAARRTALADWAASPEGQMAAFQSEVAARVTALQNEERTRMVDVAARAAAGLPQQGHHAANDNADISNERAAVQELQEQALQLNLQFEDFHGHTQRAMRDYLEHLREAVTQRRNENAEIERAQTLLERQTEAFDDRNQQLATTIAGQAHTVDQLFANARADASNRARGLNQQGLADQLGITRRGASNDNARPGQSTLDYIGIGGAGVGGSPGLDDDLNRQRIAVEESHNLGVQLQSEWRHMQEAVGTPAQAMARTVGSAFQSMTGAMTSHFRALITHREDAGEALKGMATDAIVSLSTEAFAKSLFFTAEGFADLATYQLPQAASAFTAAGIYAVVAGLSGLAAFGLTAGGGGGGSSGSAPSGNTAPAETGGYRGGGSGHNTIVVNLSVGGGMYGTKEEVGDHLRSVVTDTMSRGLHPSSTIGQAA